MADTFRIATAQNLVTTDLAANGRAVRELMVAAREQGAQMIHLPEGAISGYTLAKWPAVDWAALGKEVELTIALARELELWTVLGSNHPLTPPNRPHNCLYIIDSNGKLVDRYDKRLCSYSEINDWYSPGFETVVFEVDGFTFGCVLCIEINYPELLLEYLALDVDCVLFSSFSEKPEFELMARGYAAANNYWISMSVPAQCSTVTPSGVLGPHGSWLGSCASDKTLGIVCVDLDRNAPELEESLVHKRKWRKIARVGEVYESRRVDDDPRSLDKSQF